MEKDFGYYWFEPGAPTFLVRKLKDNVFDIRKFPGRTLYTSEGMLKDYTGDSLDPVPLRESWLDGKLQKPEGAFLKSAKIFFVQVAAGGLFLY